MNNIFLRRKCKVVVPVRGQKTPMQFLATINANIEPLGYTLSPKLMDALTKAGQSAAVEFHDWLIPVLRELKGVKDYQPTYPNFPAQVMEMDNAELYLNAIVQYFHDWVADVTGDSTISWKPTYDKTARSKLNDEVKLTVIDLGTEDEFRRLMIGLLSSPTSVSQTDKDDVCWFLDHGGFDYLPTKIPHKEMLGFVGGIAVAKGLDLSDRFKTATDILRLATAMSGGDISLATSTKFKNFRRIERRTLLGMLEQCAEITEDMLAHKNKWIRLGERLHPGEYSLPKVNFAFDVLRNDKPYETFNAKVEKAIANSDALTALDLLSKRPGMLARRLDQLLRIDVNAPIIERFKKTAGEVTTPVLLQVMAHFADRNATSELRVFFPKGSVSKAQAIKNKLSKLPDEKCSEVVKACETALIERFASLPPLGRCRIDDALKNCLVPFSQRSASKSLRTLVRGSRLPFGTGGNTVRFFIWWKQQPDDRTDLDLSAAFFGEDWQHKGHIAYYDLRSESYKACHSGDQTSAPDGACEFIDLDIPSCLEHGGRYVVMNVNSFTHQKFDALAECSAGWMIRQRPQSGEIFEPKTVKDKLDVASPTTAVIPMILDLQERNVIWADVAMKINPSKPNNVYHNLSTIGLFGKAFTEMKKPNLYDLFALHVRARGELVGGGKADKTFNLDDAFDVEKIMSEFMR